MRRFLPALAVLAALTLSGCASEQAPSVPSTPGSAVMTAFPGLPTPTGEPDLASLAEAHPKPGQAVTADGPFDDRFVVHDLAFDGAAASGSVEITSDVSDVLELMIVAGFYDAQGTLLGTARFEHHGEPDPAHVGVPSEKTDFRIPVPDALRGAAVSVAIGVPVLVNE